MPPLYQMDDLVQHLNNIFSDGDRIKVNVGNIKNPSPDFARDIILEILSEAGYTLSPNVLSLPSSLIGQNELQYVNEFISPLTIMCGARRVFEDLVAASAAGENNPVNLRLVQIHELFTSCSRYCLISLKARTNLLEI
jgi:hypothetical protein